jgi:hypothetical protein
MFNEFSNCLIEFDLFFVTCFLDRCILIVIVCMMKRCKNINQSGLMRKNYDEKNISINGDNVFV